MPIAALIPVRSFASGKGRLADVLTETQRFDLTVQMTTRTVAAAESAGMIPAIITADPDVVGWAAGQGLALIAESGPGLDTAARDGVSWAASMGLTWVVLHGDLPIVTERDLRPLIGPVEAGSAVIAPSSDGGTSAMSSPGDPAFSYGRGSFGRHLGGLGDAVVIARTGLLHDLDSPADLNSALSHPEGRWLELVVGGVVH